MSLLVNFNIEPVQLSVAFDAQVIASDVCAPLTLTNYDSGSPQNVVINPLTNAIVATATVNGGTSDSFQISSESFTTATETVAIECTYDSTNQANKALGTSCFFTDTNSPGGNFIAGVAMLPALGFMLDAVGGAPIFTGAIPLGTTVMAELDSATSTTRIACDSLGLNFAGVADGSYNNANPVFIGANNALSSPIAIGDSLGETLNAGYKPFTNVSTAKRWCEV